MEYYFTSKQDADEVAELLKGTKAYFNVYKPIVFIGFGERDEDGHILHIMNNFSDEVETIVKRKMYEQKLKKLEKLTLKN